jgi:hypothetical protein
MFRIRIPSVLFFAGFLAAVPLSGQPGKTVFVAAGSEVDHQLNDISAATDPAAKLKLIDAFSAAHPEGDLQILADEQYVNYYPTAKQYDKVFDYGDKLKGFAAAKARAKKASYAGKPRGKGRMSR